MATEEEEQAVQPFELNLNKDESMEFSDMRLEERRCSSSGCGQINKKIRKYFNSKARPVFLRLPSIEGACCHSDHSSQLFTPCHFRQLIFAIIISFGLFLTSSVQSWGSFVGVLGDDNHLPMNFTVSQSDRKWLASLPSLCSIPGNMVGFILAQAIGPANLQRYVTAFAMLTYFVKMFWPSLAMFYVSRILFGVLSGIMHMLVVPLVVELSEPTSRGHLAAIPEVVSTLGLLTTSLSLHFLNWRIAALLSCLPLLINFIGGLFVPESPLWLVRNDKKELAELSLFRTFGTCKKGRNQRMLQEIMQSTHGKLHISVSEQIELLTQRANWKPLILILTIFLLRELGGYLVIFPYAVHVFRAAGLGSTYFSSAMYIGVIRLLLNIISCGLQDLIPRRVMLATSLAVASLSLLITGGHMLSSHSNSFSWVSFIGILFYTISHGIGIGPVPWMLMAELIPNQVRFLGSAITVAAYVGVSFLIMNTFPHMMSSMGIGVSLTLFSIPNILAIILIIAVLPESRFKSLIELESLFASKETTNTYQLSHEDSDHDYHDNEELHHCPNDNGCLSTTAVNDDENHECENFALNTVYKNTTRLSSFRT